MLSYWQQTNFLGETDLLIVGSGLMGLWTAIEYKKVNPQHRVVVVDRSQFPDGASVRNAGFSCFGSPGEILSNIRTFGLEQTADVALLRFKGLHKIKQHFAAVIEYEGDGGYEVFSSPHSYGETVLQLPQLNQLMQQITGAERTFVQCDERLKEMGLTGFCGMIGNSYEGTINSGKLVLELISMAKEYGIDFIWGAEFIGFRALEKFVRVEFSRFSFRSRKLLLAMNAFNAKYLPSETIVPARGQILMTDAIPKLKLNGSFHYDEGYYYFRNVGKHVLIGGARNTAMEDERTFEMRTTNEIQRHLEIFLRQHILSKISFEIQWRWAGIMSFSHKSLPIVHQISSNVFAANACNGMGVALTAVFAETVVQRLGED